MQSGTMFRGAILLTEETQTFIRTSIRQWLMFENPQKTPLSPGVFLNAGYAQCLGGTEPRQA